MEIKPIETIYKGYRFRKIDNTAQTAHNTAQMYKGGCMPNRWGFINRVGERYGRLTVIEFECNIAKGLLSRAGIS